DGTGALRVERKKNLDPELSVSAGDEGRCGLRRPLTERPRAGTSGDRGRRGGGRRSPSGRGTPVAAPAQNPVCRAPSAAAGETLAAAGRKAYLPGRSDSAGEVAGSG